MTDLLREGYNQRDKIIFLLVFLLIACSLLINLGGYAFYHEEPRRALTTLEMIYSGNFISPTYLGEFYYKKTPLFNWLLYASFELFGAYSEFAARFVSVISHLLLGFFVYLFAKNYFPKKLALYSAIFFLISVQIYFHASTVAEIDLFYSLITFTGMAAVLYFYEKEKYLWLFVTTYFLNGIGFLTKALPSIFFVGITLVVFFFYKKDLKRLFSWQHVAGMLTFAVLVGGYFLMYSEYNSVEAYLAGLWGQSSEKTVLENSWQESVLSFLTFPFQFLKDALPASLFVVFCFRKDFLKIIDGHQLLKFSFYILISNIIIYWVSPLSAPRYTLMLLPFLIYICLYFYYNYIRKQAKIPNYLSFIMLLFMGATFLASIAINFIAELNIISNLWLVSLLASLGSLFLIIIFLKNPEYKLLSFILSFVVVRFVFDFTVPAHRTAYSNTQKDKEIAYEIAEIVNDQDLFLYDSLKFSQTTYFYLEKALGKTLTFKSDIDKQVFYIATPDQLVHKTSTEYYDFLFRGGQFKLIKFE